MPDNQAPVREPCAVASRTIRSCERAQRGRDMSSVQTSGLTTDIAGLDKTVGSQLGPTEWTEMTQQLVNEFADLTGDHNFIHVDLERAKQTPFGGTIAHGYLSLSL